MSKEIKKVEIINYHAFLLSRLLQPLKLNNKDQRQARKKIFRLIDPVLNVLQEELEVLREKHADVDEKGEKIVASKMGNQVNYQISKENQIKLDAEFNELLNERTAIDLMPTDQEAMPAIKDLIENIPTPLSYQEESFLDNFQLSFF